MSALVTISDFKRKEQRYRFSDHALVQVSVKTDDGSSPIDAALVDLSCSGIQLRMPCCLKFEQAIIVRVVAKECRFELTASAKWLRQADDQSWFVGCRISPELPEHVLAQLATLKLLERRGGTRREVNCEVLVSGQLDQGWAPAVVRNVSEDGFGLTSLEPCPVGQRVRLMLPGTDGDSVHMTAQVIWQLESWEGYSSGFSFLSRDCVNLLNSLIETDPVVAAPIAKRASKPSHRIRYAVAGSSLAMVVFAGILWMMTEREHSPAPSINAEQAPTTQLAALDANDGPPIVPVETVRNPETPPQVPPSLPVPTPAPSSVKSTPPEVKPEVKPVVKPEIIPAESNIKSGDVTANPKEVATSIDPSASSSSLKPQASGLFRTWVDDSGQFRVVVRLVSVQDGTVRLLKENGRFTSVPLDRLSPEDRQYAQKWDGEPAARQP